MPLFALSARRDRSEWLLLIALVRMATMMLRSPPVKCVHICAIDAPQRLNVLIVEMTP